MPFARECVQAALGAILVGLVLAAPGCTGKDDAWTYSVEDVRGAFRDAGYPLREVIPPAGAQIVPPAGVRSPASEGTYLEPLGGGPPWVLVTSLANVDDPSGGCNASGAPAGSALWLLALGMIVARSRRRQLSR